MHTAIVFASFISYVASLNNGVGKLPKMGYDTFNAFGCDYNASSVLAVAQAMHDTGLVEAGYNSIILDDCYTLRSRSTNGSLVADPAKFPNGIKNFTTLINALGISASAYSDRGYETCAGYPGSYNHEVQDLLTWQSWGFDYIKYDNCYSPFDNITTQGQFGSYKVMADAIAEVAEKTHTKPFEYSLCNWGWDQVWIWGGRLGHSWRIDGDIKPWWTSIAAIINQASFIWWSTNHYGRNDMDIMEVGNTDQGTPVGNLTHEESKSHFTAWALLKSPLIIGTDLTNTSNPFLKANIEILKNKDLIRINQDPNVGESISPFRWGTNSDYVSNSTHPAEYWSGNSSYGVVFMILNSQDKPQTMAFNLTESWAIRAGRQYSVYDMWSHTHNGTAVRNLTFTLPGHGVAALLLNDAGPEPEGLFPYCGLYWQCAFANGTYSTN